MKKLFIILGILFINLSFGQTTQEEYNYITKGYKVQLESGLDMKKGYTLKVLDLQNVSIEKQTRMLEFSALLKDNNTKPVAIMMKYNRTDISNGHLQYFCIPTPDAPINLWQQTYESISLSFTNTDVVYKTIIYALMKFASTGTYNVK